MANTKTLKLVLKYKWYDMIDEGIKPEEYREIKDSIVSVLFDWKKSQYTRDHFTRQLKRFPDSQFLLSHLKKYDCVQFFRGYSKDRKTMLFKFDMVYIGKCKSEWSDGWKDDVFVIKLGERINPIIHCHLPENASCETKQMLNQLAIKAYTQIRK